LEPGAFDLKELEPMYEKLHRTYMNNSADSISWFEPNTFLNVIGVKVDGDYSGTDKVFIILKKLVEEGKIDESLL
jgi:hypothetical protein